MLSGSPSFAALVYGQIVPLFDTAIIPLLYALAFIFFLIGMTRYFFTANEESHTKGRAFMLAAIIGFVVIFSVWGIVNVLLASLQGAI